MKSATTNYVLSGYISQIYIDIVLVEVDLVVFVDFVDLVVFVVPLVLVPLVDLVVFVVPLVLVPLSSGSLCALQTAPKFDMT